MTTEITLKVGRIWVRKRDGRRAVIIRINDEPWNSVEYRYRSALPDDQRRGHTNMVPRVNLTCRSIKSFVAAFKPEEMPLVLGAD